MTTSLHPPPPSPSPLLTIWFNEKLTDLHLLTHPIYRFVDLHSVKSVRIRSYPGPYFSAFGLNTERYGVSNYIQSECRKTQTKKHCFIYNGKSKNIALYAYFCMFLKSLKAFIVPWSYSSSPFRANVLSAQCIALASC